MINQEMSSLIGIKPNPNVPEINPGDTVRVSMKVVEGERQRTQAFEGLVIRVRRGGAGADFTVRRVVHSVGVERTFPLYSPRLEKVEVMRRGKVRRAKLYYIRYLSRREARFKIKARAKDELR